MYKLTWKEQDASGQIHDCFDQDKDPVALINWFDNEYKRAGRGWYGLIVSVPELTQMEETR